MGYVFVGGFCAQPTVRGIFGDPKARGKLVVIAPLAFEAVKRIDAIFDVEREINGRSITERLAVRRARVAPLVSDLEIWMRTQRTKLSRHSDVGKAMDYMLKRWDTFTRLLVLAQK